ncbi:MAG: hypothetical protein KAJ19_10070 [Gammaproteobacteria bacterium]|nr:hypothetical protein [Gammaproteobacteria bacterium]
MGYEILEGVDFGELTLEVEWRNASGEVVVVDKLHHIQPGDVAHLPYPTPIITRHS